ERRVADARHAPRGLGRPARSLSSRGARRGRTSAEQSHLREGAVNVAIHQPQYLPWLGYLAKWAAADLFVLLDAGQYEKNGWQTRNRIKTPDGARWLTVPVRARLGMRIADVAVDRDQPWPLRHLRSIEGAYSGAPFWRSMRDALSDLYAEPWERLGAPAGGGGGAARPRGRRAAPAAP